MRASGNNYTCVAYTGGKYNKSPCGMPAKYRLPNATIPTHCYRHQKRIINMIEDGDAPRCHIADCNRLCPQFGPVGNLPVLCDRCNKTAVEYGLHDYVDCTKQCRILRCCSQATHGATGTDLEPWLCPDHAGRMKFACSVIYKSKCVQCDNHATYATFETYSNTDSRISVCNEHVVELIAAVRTDFMTVGCCQALYCDQPVEVETKYVPRIEAHVQCHGLCAKHKRIHDHTGGRCEGGAIDRQDGNKLLGGGCTNTATCVFDGKNLCQVHLNSFANTALAPKPAPIVDKSALSTKIGNLAREMNVRQQRNLIDSIMQAVSPASGRSAGTLAATTRKRTISQMESSTVPSTPATPMPATPMIATPMPTTPMPTTPISIPTVVVSPVRSDPATPASQVSLPPTPRSCPELSFPEVATMDDVDVSMGLTNESMISTPLIYNDDGIFDICLGSQDSYTTKLCQHVENPLFDTTNYVIDDQPDTTNPDTVIRDVIGEYKFDYDYYSAAGCYRIHAPTPVYIVLGDSGTNRDQIVYPATCAIVRVRSAITYDLIRALFLSLQMTFTSPFSPKYCEYEI